MAARNACDIWHRSSRLHRRCPPGAWDCIRKPMACRGIQHDPWPATPELWSSGLRSCHRFFFDMEQYETNDILKRSRGKYVASRPRDGHLPIARTGSGWLSDHDLILDIHRQHEKNTYLSHGQLEIIQGASCPQTIPQAVYNQQVNPIVDISMDIYGRYMELSLLMSYINSHLW